MTRKISALILLISIICVVGLYVKTKVEAHSVASTIQEAESNTQWVARSLTEMETIKPGMTRAELMNVFTVEGGLSTDLWQTFVFKKCPYFKVDVEFKPVGRPARDRDGRVTLVKSDKDIITKISKPYIARMVLD